MNRVKRWFLYQYYRFKRLKQEHFVYNGTSASTLSIHANPDLYDLKQATFSLDQAKIKNDLNLSNISKVHIYNEKNELVMDGVPLEWFERFDGITFNDTYFKRVKKE